MEATHPPGSETMIEKQIKEIQAELHYEPFADPSAKEKMFLSVTEAKERASIVSKVKYVLALILHKGNEYLGQVTTEFELSSTNENLYFDFEGKELLFFQCNGEIIPGKNIFAKRKIHIPPKSQKTGLNHIVIVFRNVYATNGNGLHHFKDPQDQEEYLYSNFEPFAANKMFPCFDQPNLKAPFKLITVTPPNWVVVGNELERLTIPVAAAEAALKELKIPHCLIGKELAESYILREFNPTPAVSTYLFTCIAGPYDLFVSSRKPGEGYPPMRIFVRKSLKEFVTPYAEEFFRITECGIKFYEESFGQPFPFSKHDQIYCPEFNVGAMENVGAVTYTETYVFKDPPTEEKFMRFAETILHELSHMWFGDLVTMKWWNDLWLNESFATFISNLCMGLAKGLDKYRSVWTLFHKYKGWAYREDQEPTTHPITAIVENTEDAENIFDGITYMKGASTLKQLYYLISHEAFCEGVKDYFATYKWKNTELKDFIGSLQKALVKKGSTLDLHAWTKQWLETKGLNELRPEFEVKEGKIVGFKIVQEFAANGDKEYRMHMLDIAIYDEAFKMTTIERVLVESKPVTLVPRLNGLAAPTAVLLNVNDYAFCKVQLDPTSVHSFQKNLTTVADNLTRMIIWRSYWDMVRDCKTSSKEFLALVSSQGIYEREEGIFTGALNYASSAAVFYVPQEYHQIEETPIFEKLYARLKTETSANLKKHLVGYIIRFANTHEHKLMLKKWVEEGTKIEGAPLSQSQRYSIIAKIYRDKEFPLAEKEKLLAEELSKDKSDEGLRAKQSCEAALPDAANKERLWKWYNDENSKDSEHTIFASMEGFVCWGQEDILKPYTDKYFEAIPTVFAKRPRSYAESFFHSLKPNEVSEAILKKFEDLTIGIKDTEKTLKKLVLEEIEDLKRTLKAQNLYRASIGKK